MTTDDAIISNPHFQNDSYTTHFAQTDNSTPDCTAIYSAATTPRKMAAKPPIPLVTNPAAAALEAVAAALELGLELPVKFEALEGVVVSVPLVDAEVPLPAPVAELVVTVTVSLALVVVLVLVVAAVAVADPLPVPAPVPAPPAVVVVELAVSCALYAAQREEPMAWMVAS